MTFVQNLSEEKEKYITLTLPTVNIDMFISIFDLLTRSDF